MKIIPYEDKILVETTKEDGLEDEITEGGIIRVDSARKRKGVGRAGKVLAVGPGKLTDDGKRVGTDHIKAGTMVLLNQYAGTAVPGMPDWRLVHAADVIAGFDFTDEKEKGPKLAVPDKRILVPR